MTATSWVVCMTAWIVIICIAAPLVIAAEFRDSVLGGIAKAGILTVAVLACIGTYKAMYWAQNNTESGKRALIDQKSNLNGGLERTVTVYTADGKIMAQYKGRIDIEGNDGGYVIFDYNGKRYTYYNCFVESVADIDG